MVPAPSVILLSVLTGLGFGTLTFLGFGAEPFFAPPLAWGLGYALSAAGLLASVFHLRQPQRLLLAFSQWRSSWLSREAWDSVAALALLAPVSFAEISGAAPSLILARAGALCCLAAVISTSMIYAQLVSVPRWNHWTTPVLFVAFAVTGGAILTAQPAAAPLCLLLAIALVAEFRDGDQRFARRGATIGSATGIGGIGTPRSFAPPHTGTTYVTRELIHVVGRKHAARLRLLAVVLAGLAPALVLLAMPTSLASTALAGLLHLTGALVARWLFFAQAEHVLGLFYGRP